MRHVDTSTRPNRRAWRQWLHRAYTPSALRNRDHFVPHMELTPVTLSDVLSPVHRARTVIAREGWGQCPCCGSRACGVTRAMSACTGRRACSHSSMPSTSTVTHAVPAAPPPLALRVDLETTTAHAGQEIRGILWFTNSTTRAIATPCPIVGGLTKPLPQPPAVTVVVT
jgi:hypothetical protein